jgi:hypothetical protein
MGNNSHHVKGTIYDIHKEPIVGKKDPSKVYYKYIITLEIKEGKEVTHGDKTYYASKAQFPQYEWFNPPEDIIEKFNIADFVELDFYCSGTKFTYKNGDRAGKEGIMNSNNITRINFADLNLDGGHSNHKGKIKVDSMTDPEVLKIQETFVPMEEDDEFKDLPF